MNFDSYMEHCYAYDTKAYTISTLALQYINDTNRSVFYLVCSPNDVFFLSLSCSPNEYDLLDERRDKKLSGLLTG